MAAPAPEDRHSSEAGGGDVVRMKSEAACVGAEGAACCCWRLVSLSLSTSWLAADTDQKRSLKEGLRGFFGSGMVAWVPGARSETSAWEGLMRPHVALAICRCRDLVLLEAAGSCITFWVSGWNCKWHERGWLSCCSKVSGSW